MNARRMSRRRTVTVALGTLVACIVLAVGYYYAGYQSMESQCQLDSCVPEGAAGGSYETAWSWSPPGFRCAWPASDGSGTIGVVKLWWS